VKPKGLTGANLVLLLVLGAIWGTAFMFITLGLRPEDPSFSPILFAALRFDLAGLTILGIALARRAPLVPRSRKQWAAIGIAALLNVCMYHALLFIGQPYVDESVASIIVALNPILTTVASRIFLTDERLGATGLVGLASGLVGVVILTLASRAVFAGAAVGLVFVLGAILSWSLGSTLVKRTGHGMDVFAFTAWQMLAGAVLLHAGAFLFDPGHGFARFDRDGILSLLYLAEVSSAVGFILYFTLLERVGPIRTNLVSNVAPIFATLAGILVLGTAFHWLFLVAFVFIAGGFLLVARPNAEKKAKEPAAVLPAEEG
jgi:drug/metabolite transporter (DMT)-like permease